MSHAESVFCAAWPEFASPGEGFGDSAESTQTHGSTLKSKATEERLVLTRYILILLNGMTENHRVHVITATLRRRAAGLKLRRHEVKVLNEVL